MIFSKILEFIFGRRRDDYGPSGWVSDRGSVDNNSSKKSTPKNDIDTLCNTVANGEYIANLRIGRSWILPQLLEMGGVRKGHLCFDIDMYENAVRNMPYSKQCDILMHNLEVLSSIEDKDPEGYEARARWWTKDVVKALYSSFLNASKKKIQNQKVYTNCTGGDYVSVKKWGAMYFVKTPNPNSKWNAENSDTIDSCFERMNAALDELAKTDSYWDINNVVLPLKLPVIFSYGNYYTTPDQFVSAFAGDGAYSAMRTLVKFWNLTYEDAYGRMMSREECLADIEAKAEQFKDDGMKLMRYCVEKFLAKPNVLRKLFA